MTDTNETTETTETTETDEDMKPGDDGRFDAEYVTKLRTEAADRRTAAQEAETARQAAEEAVSGLRARLLTAEVVAAATGVLVDPSDLIKLGDPADLVDDNGEPDPDRIKTAAEKLAADRPHLAAKRVTGDVGQGARGGTTPPPVDFGGRLRAAVG